jgi:hypothetical protein
VEVGAHSAEFFCELFLDGVRDMLVELVVPHRAAANRRKYLSSSVANLFVLAAVRHDKERAPLLEAESIFRF